MTEEHDLVQAIASKHFPTIDAQLRRGAHISADDVEWHAFTKQHYSVLSKFYLRYQAVLKEGTEGYFYLVSEGAMFGRRQLSKGEMLVGLTIAHLYRDPEHRVRNITGQVTVEHVLSRLEILKAKEDIARVMCDAKLKLQVHPQKVREAVLDAIKRLASLNFLHLVDLSGTVFRCKRPIHRFDHFVMELNSLNGSDQEEHTDETK
jgi:chromosome partition protein MukE